MSGRRRGGGGGFQGPRPPRNNDGHRRGGGNQQGQHSQHPQRQQFGSHGDQDNNHFGLGDFEDLGQQGPQHDGHGYGQRGRAGWDGPPHQAGPNSAHRNFRQGLAVPKPVASAGGSSTGGAMQSLGSVIRPRNARPSAPPPAAPAPPDAAPAAVPPPTHDTPPSADIMNLPTGPRRGAPPAAAAAPVHAANGTLDEDPAADHDSDAGPGADDGELVVPERASGAADQAARLAAMVRAPTQGPAADAAWDEPAAPVTHVKLGASKAAGRASSHAGDAQVAPIPGPPLEAPPPNVARAAGPKASAPAPAAPAHPVAAKPPTQQTRAPAPVPNAWGSRPGALAAKLGGHQEPAAARRPPPLPSQQPPPTQQPPPPADVTAPAVPPPAEPAETPAPPAAPVAPTAPAGDTAALPAADAPPGDAPVASAPAAMEAAEPQAVDEAPSTSREPVVTAAPEAPTEQAQSAAPAAPAEPAPAVVVTPMAPGATRPAAPAAADAPVVATPPATPPGLGRRNAARDAAPPERAPPPAAQPGPPRMAWGRGSSAAQKLFPGQGAVALRGPAATPPPPAALDAPRGKAKGDASQGPRAVVESSLPAEPSAANAEPLPGPAPAAPVEQQPPAETAPPSAASGPPHEPPAPAEANALARPPGLPPPVEGEVHEVTTAAAVQPGVHEVANDVPVGGGPPDAAPPPAAQPAESATPVAAPAPAPAPAATAAAAAETPPAPAVKMVWGKPAAVSPAPPVPAHRAKPPKAEPAATAETPVPPTAAATPHAAGLATTQTPPTAPTPAPHSAAAAPAAGASAAEAARDAAPTSVSEFPELSSVPAQAAKASPAKGGWASIAAAAADKEPPPPSRPPSRPVAVPRQGAPPQGRAPGRNRGGDAPQSQPRAGGPAGRGPRPDRPSQSPRDSRGAPRERGGRRDAHGGARAGDPLSPAQSVASDGPRQAPSAQAAAAAAPAVPAEGAAAPPAGGEAAAPVETASRTPEPELAKAAVPEPAPLPKPKQPLTPKVLEAVRALCTRPGDEVVEEHLLRLEPRGLANPGNLCFMNSVLQMLMASSGFCNFLHKLQDAAPALDESSPMLSALASLGAQMQPLGGTTSGVANGPSAEANGVLESGKKDSTPDARPAKPAQPNAWSSGGGNRLLNQLYPSKSFVPNMMYPTVEQFTAKIGAPPPQGKKSLPAGAHQQQDAQEYLHHLLNMAHEELLHLRKEHLADQSEAPKPPTEQAGKDEEWSTVGPKNKLAVERGEAEAPGGSTLATKPFAGTLRSEVKGKGFKVSATLESFTVFHLNITSPGILTVDDALRLFTQPEPIEDYKTDDGKMVAASKTTTLGRLPRVLILHFCRFTYMNGTFSKITRPVKFNDVLRLQPKWVSGGKGAEYELIATVSHIGRTMSSGHYKADVRQPDGSWLRFDDAEVSTVTKGDVLHGQAYMLVYQMRT